jgi:hypothetical protein
MNLFDKKLNDLLYFKEEFQDYAGNFVCFIKHFKPASRTLPRRIEISYFTEERNDSSGILSSHASYSWTEYSLRKWLMILLASSSASLSLQHQSTVREINLT